MNDDVTSGMSPGVSTPDGEGQADFSAPGKPRVSRATIAMGLIFAAGVAIVVALSTGTGPQEASASDAAVEAQVESFLVHTRTKNDLEADADGDALVDRFYNYAYRRQVPLDQLRTNPFSRGGDVAVTTEDPTKKPVIRANAKRRAELQREFATLKLQGIMVTSRGGTAIIGGEFVTAGGKVGSFRVKAISPDHVELTCEEMSFELQLQR